MSVTKNFVKEEIEKHESFFDGYMFFTEGINSVNDYKHYVQNNAILFETKSRKGIYRHGHLKCSLMLHYISQEKDFSSWYHEHDTRNTHVGY
uniref:Uncharacterized protein n=1 Tax=viral metagenome TaxID=1070528 RepID=A0A6C0AEP0_9ZZZZ